jgi:hypothetical protein
VIFKAKKSKPGVNSFSLFLAQASSGSRFFCLLIVVVVDVVLSFSNTAKLFLISRRLFLLLGLAKDLVGAFVGVWHGCFEEKVLFTTSKRSVMEEDRLH